LVCVAFTARTNVLWMLRNQWNTCLNYCGKIRIRVTHIFREGNVCADKLVNLGFIHVWPSFTSALELRFIPSSYTNTKLNYSSCCMLVFDYQARFEKICNCIRALSPETILNCFISSLHPEIRRELNILNLYSIS